MNLTKAKNSILIVYFISLVANILLFYFVYRQLNHVGDLKSYWATSAEENLLIATELTKIERSFGYVGFIHHFKNYIIRRDEKYYANAINNYHQIKTAIQTLRALTHSKAEQLHLHTIEKTIDQYYYKLELAKEQSLALDINQLDALVKVDDTPAEMALNQLRESILPKINEQKRIIDNKVNTLNANTLNLGYLLFPLFFITTIFTIYILKKLLIAYQQVAIIFEMTPDGIIYIDTDGDILQANKAASNIFGYPHKEFVTLKIEDLLPERLKKNHITDRQAFMQMEQARQMGDRNAHIQARRKNGSLIDVKISIAARKINNQMKSVCVIKDMTEHRKLEKCANSDHLTGLHNRRYFDDILRKELKRNYRENRQLSLMLIDLDNFKALNDAEGHTAGDIALQELAEFLKENTRTYDHLARWGGDEFTLLCPQLNENDAIKHAERIRKGFEQLEFIWQEPITLSIGIATTSVDNPYSLGGFIEAADKAVYAAKEEGRNKVIHVNQLS